MTTAASAPLRVAHVINCVDPSWGGTTTQLVALTAAQARAGMRVTVVSTFAKGFNSAAADAMKAAGVHVVLVGPAWRPLGWHPSLAATLARHLAGADVLHVHAVWEEIQHRAAVLARRQGVRYVITPHGMLDQWSLAQGATKKKLYLALRLRRNMDRAALVHFTDDAEKSSVAALGLKTPTLVRPYAVDLAEYETLPPPGTFARLFPHIGAAPYVLFLGRLHYKKGLDLLLPAYARAERAGVKLVIAGPASSDDYLQQLKATVARLGLNDDVIFTGMLEGDAKRAAYAGARLFVVPSHQENFGLVVPEALASGTPVLLSHGVAIHRHITAAGVGEALPLEEAAWTQALSAWLPDAARCESVGTRGRAWVRATYDADVTARAWDATYRSLGPARARQ